MMIVIDRHPVLSAVVATVVMVMFIVGSVWLAAYSLQNVRSKKSRADVRYAVVGVVGTIFWLVFAAWWWRDWSPWAVEITDNAVVLRYLLSTQQIELTDVERVEFELVRPGRRYERSILRLSSGGHGYQITQDPEPPGELATRPVRQVFDQLAVRLPPNKSRDVTK